VIASSPELTGLMTVWTDRSLSTDYHPYASLGDEERAHSLRGTNSSRVRLKGKPIAGYFAMPSRSIRQGDGF